MIDQCVWHIQDKCLLVVFNKRVKACEGSKAKRPKACALFYENFLIKVYNNAMHPSDRIKNSFYGFGHQWISKNEGTGGSMKSEGLWWVWGDFHSSLYVKKGTGQI